MQMFKNKTKLSRLTNIKMVGFEHRKCELNHLHLRFNRVHHCQQVFGINFTGLLIWWKWFSIGKQYGEKIGEFEISLEGWYSIDITEYVKFLIENNYFSFENSSIMLKLKDNNAGTVVISSCDNSMYPPFFEVNYLVEEWLPKVIVLTEVLRF